MTLQENYKRDLAGKRALVPYLEQIAGGLAHQHKIPLNICKKIGITTPFDRFPYIPLEVVAIEAEDRKITPLQLLEHLAIAWSQELRAEEKKLQGKPDVMYPASIIGPYAVYCKRESIFNAAAHSAVRHP